MIESGFYFNQLHKGELRNKPCVCNSGKKTKKCHGANGLVTKEEAIEIAGLVDLYIKKMNYINNAKKFEIKRADA